MSFKIVLSRVLLPAAAVCTVTEYKCKPSELPIYKPDLDSKTWKGNCPNTSAATSHQAPTLIEEAVGTIRKQLVSVRNEVAVYKDSAASAVHSCIDQAAWLRNYLADENNVAPKPGAIGIGALAGFLVGLRGGLARRVVSTSAGALMMAAVCYPRQAADYAKLGLAETKKYVTIGYNFVYGGNNAGDKEVDMAALLLIDLDPTYSKSQSVVKGLHDSAGHADCHCPVGTCLSPHDDDEGAHDGDNIIVHGGDECCACVCEDEDYD